MWAVAVVTVVVVVGNSYCHWVVVVVVGVNDCWEICWSHSPRENQLSEWGNRLSSRAVDEGRRCISFYRRVALRCVCVCVCGGACVVKA